MLCLKAKAMRKEEDMDDKPAEASQSLIGPSRKGPKVVETDDELGDDALLGEVHTGEDEWLTKAV